MATGECGSASHITRVRVQSPWWGKLVRGSLKLMSFYLIDHIFCDILNAGPISEIVLYTACMYL